MYHKTNVNEAYIFLCDFGTVSGSAEFKFKLKGSM